MDINYTTDDSCWNLMHQTHDQIRIGENAKVTQHYPDFQNSNIGDDEEHIETPHCPIIAVNVAKNNARICQSENALKGHTRSRP